MRPPSKDAITRALNILLESIQVENKRTFASSCDHPLDAIPFKQLATNAKALGLAKVHLDKEADDLISRIQHHRNVAAPIHRLPQEILAIILESVAADIPVHDLLEMLRIGRLWYTAIVTSPRLWTWLDATLPPKIARLVIERSNNLPILSLDWNTADAHDNHKDHTPILEIAVQASTRFKSMNFQVSSYPPFEIRPLLESPTPALETLVVEVGKGTIARWAGLGTFILSEGAPLKYLVLHDISINFDSPRLSGLVTLHLYRAAVPASLPVLLQVLSTTQWLEQLVVCENSRIQIGDAAVPGPQITLEHLAELKIDDIDSGYCAALLSSIYAPACSFVYVSEVPRNDGINPLDPLLWQPGNPQMAALLGLDPQSRSVTQALRISIVVQHGVVRIHVRDQEGDGTRFFSFTRLQPWEMLRLLGHFFSNIPDCPAVDLAISSAMADTDSFDLTPWTALLESLQLSDSRACLRALEQLAQCTAPPNASEGGTIATQMEDWMCPNLKYVTLYILKIASQRELHVAALLSLVKKRWSGTDGGPAPANQPAEFEIICPRSDCMELQGVEAEVQRVVPTFVLRGRG